MIHILIMNRIKEDVPKGWERGYSGFKVILDLSYIVVEVNGIKLECEKFEV